MNRTIIKVSLICFLQFSFSIVISFLLNYELYLLNREYGIWGLIYRITVIISYFIIGLLFGILSQNEKRAEKGRKLPIIIGIIMLLFAICDCFLYKAGYGWILCSNFAFTMSLSAGYLLFCFNTFYKRKLLLYLFVLYFVLLPFVDVWIKQSGNELLSKTVPHVLFIIVGVLFALPSDKDLIKSRKQIVIWLVFTIAIIGAIVCKESGVFGSKATIDTLMIWDMLVGYGCVSIVNCFLL